MENKDTSIVVTGCKTDDLGHKYFVYCSMNHECSNEKCETKKISYWSKVTTTATATHDENIVDTAKNLHDIVSKKSELKPCPTMSGTKTQMIIAKIMFCDDQKTESGLQILFCAVNPDVKQLSVDSIKTIKEEIVFSDDFDDEFLDLEKYIEDLECHEDNCV